MPELRREMRSFMADAIAIFPNLTVKNTFLHCELQGSNEASRSVSCPPAERPQSGTPELSTPRCRATLEFGSAEKAARAKQASVERIIASTSTSKAMAAPKGAGLAVAALRQVASTSASKPVARPLGTRANLAPSPASNPPATSSASSPSPKSAAVRNVPSLQMAMAAAARGPPPYAPPVAKSARQGKSTASGPPALGDVVASPLVKLSNSANPIETEATSVPKRPEENLPSEDQGEWAVVEVKRKKRPQLINSTGEVTSKPPHEPHQAIQHEVDIGIKDDPEFHVVKRLLGPGGANIDRIRGNCEGTKVELRGVGTQSSGDGSGPLVLRIKGHDASQCATALARAEELVRETRQEYESFLASRFTEESTSADDSVHPLNDTTDSDADDAIAGDLTASRSQVLSEQGTSSNEGGYDQASGHTAAASQMAKSERPENRHAATMGALVHHEVPVGIKHTSQFPTVRKLIGPGGGNMRSISSACPGTKVELRGAGTNPWSGGEAGPLVLHIRGHDSVQCAEALKRATELIDRVRREHQLFLDSRSSRLT